MKMALVSLLSSALSSPLITGCGQEHACTLEERGYSAAMKRPFTAEGPLETFEVEACVGTKCTTGTSDTSGTLSFPDRDDAATDGEIDRATQTLRVTFQLWEHNAAPTQFVLRVKRNGTQVSHETAALEWTDDGCHAAPVKTSL